MQENRGTHTWEVLRSPPTIVSRRPLLVLLHFLCRRFHILLQFWDSDSLFFFFSVFDICFYFLNSNGVLIFFVQLQLGILDIWNLEALYWITISHYYTPVPFFSFLITFLNNSGKIFYYFKNPNISNSLVLQFDEN